MSEKKVEFRKKEPDFGLERIKRETIQILRAKVPRKKFGFPKK